ncbi:Pre-rRNA-processing protein ipi3 [Saitozyma podzolica]|uniref:Pre-rRNA-processing protein IPI3 n=1 Tax=Saitozyma podzolica TaxID=1890683 RepID=A0A427YW48_9TREE|nr:Pre-rRNA-processing protein ipi3 [Saitozyma podzolica]
MGPQEVILSACGSEVTATSVTGRAAAAPAVQVHDLLSSAHLASFKTSTSALHSLSYVQSSGGSGGSILAVQEGKALVNVWAWQKDQLHLKLHLPEKLSCFSVSPNGHWAAGGSPTGQLASGLLLASYTAHYRAVTSLTFTADSNILLSASLDASVHVYVVSRVVDEEDSGVVGKPYGTLSDHTLGIRAVAVGRTAGSSGGRCWTASDDGTVKMWSLYPPFDLLATFSLPPSVTPTSLAVDPSERFFYVGTTQGDIYYVPLFKRREEMGGRLGDVEAVGGEGQGGAPIKAEGSVVSVKSPVTCLALSLSTSHLLIGTRAGEIHIHSLPSHQHLRTIASHSGPITHLSALLRPSDLIGGPFKSDAWPVMEVKPLERMRVGKAARDVQEVTMLLRPRVSPVALDSLRSRQAAPLSVVSAARTDTGDRLAELEAENRRLRAGLDKALQINEKMWSGIVDMKLVDAPAANGSQ